MTATSNSGAPLSRPLDKRAFGEWKQKPDGAPYPPSFGRCGIRLLEAGLVAIVCFALLGTGPSRSADARFNELGHKLMCKCGCNQILLECNHVGCAYSTQMRDELMAALTRGSSGPGSSTPDSDELVLQSFVQKYGATVLAAPTTSGFNIVAWIIPFVALVLGIMLVVVIIRKWKFRLQPVGAQDLSATELDEFRRRAREETQL